VTNGSFALQIEGLYGRRAALEVSSNLSTWLFLADVTSTNEPVLFEDSILSGVPRRFYRVVMPATNAPQSGSLQVTLAPAGAVNSGAQWRVDGQSWQNSGTTVPGLPVGNHTLEFSVVPGWGSPATESITINSAQTTVVTALYTSPRTATATAIATNGFVVAATITDGGVGYTNVPAVYILGGGGSGAQAIATISNGVVVGITITDAGFGYTNVPTIVIASPFPLKIGISPAKGVGFTNLFVGKTYQLQVSKFGGWINSGAPFVAGTNTLLQYFDGWLNGSSYRLVQLPIPYGATATPILSYGFVVAAIVTDGGFGYVSVPNVVITGGGGSGAQATSTISNGVVTAISIVDAGFGYTNTPTIQIDPPPIPFLAPTSSSAVRLDYSGLTPMLTYQLEASQNFSNWTNWGSAFTATANTNSQYLDLDADSRFFRLRQP
jgi:hypothetical protein